MRTTQSRIGSWSEPATGSSFEICLTCRPHRRPATTDNTSACRRRACGIIRSVCLSVCLSICLFVRFFVCLFFCLSLSISSNVYFVYISGCLYVCRSVCLSVNLLSLCVSVSFSPIISLLVYSSYLSSKKLFI